MLISFIYLSIYISIYFLNIGFFTILERKTLSLLQNRKSIYRISFLNFYHFFLDFFKSLGKGVYDLEMLKIQYSCLLIFFIYFMIILCLSFLLPINFYSVNYYYGFFFYVILDNSFIFFKIFITNIFDFKFSKFTFQKMKKIYLYVESVFLMVFFILLSFFSFIGISLITKSGKILNLDFFNLSSIIFIFFIFLVILFSLLIFKYFRIPFDFLEIETEFVGGLILEFFGIIFTLWMLFEYAFIFNGVLYFISLLSFFYHINFIVFLIFLSIVGLFLIILVFLSKGILVRVRFFSIFFVLNKIFFIYLLIVLLLSVFFVIF